MSIKLKDTIFDYIDKAYKDGSGNTISSTYLPLSGGTYTLSYINNTALIVKNNGTTGTASGIRFDLGSKNGAWVGYSSNVGSYLSNYPSTYFIGIKDDGTPYYNNGTFNTLIHSGNYTDYTYSKSTIDTKLSGYLPLSGGAITNNLTVSKSASKDSTITPTTCILNIGTRGAGHTGYHTGIGFNALRYDPYTQHIHAWIGLGTYTTTATAECYPLVFATNENTTTNTAPVERMKIAPDGAVSINKSLTVGGYTVITSGNIGSQSVNYASSAGSVAWGNVSGKPSTFSPSSHTHDYLPLGGGEMTGSISHTLEPSGGRIIYGKTRNSGIKYDYNGNECLMISTGTYAKASIAMYTYNRISLNDSNGQWNVSSPDMHIKNGCVAINKLIANDTNLSYNLDINGSFNATSGYIGGNAVIHSGNIGSQSVNYASSAGSINGLSFSAVTSLPSSPNSSTVYFVTG